MYTFQSRGLKNLRLAAKLSQGNVSKQLGLGSPQFISNIENGKASIPSKMIVPLAGLLKVKPEEITKLKIIDYILELSETAKSPDVRIHAEKIMKYEKSLKKIIGDSFLDSEIHLKQS